MDRARHPQLKAIQRQIETAFARDAVSKALYAVIVEGMELGPCSLPIAEDREWIRGAIAVPIQEAGEVALEVLAWRLAQALDQAPERLREQFERSRRWQTLGWDDPPEINGAGALR